MDVTYPNGHFRGEVFPDSGLPNYRINIYARGLAGLRGNVGSIGLSFLCAEGNKIKEIPVVIQPASQGVAPYGLPPAF